MNRITFTVLGLVFFLTACSGPGAETGVGTVIAVTATTVPATQPAVTNTPISTSVDQSAASDTPTAIPTSTSPPPPTPTEAAPEANLSGNPDLDFAQVEFVRAVQAADGTWRFDVTVRHNDQGWDHYADLWQVVDMQDNVLGERVLLHPHDTEQPFTRSQSGISIPADTMRVVVRAKCNVHGFGGQEILLDLTSGSGQNFEVSKAN